MALVHETLYRTKDFSNVDMDFYVTTLVGKVAATYPLPKDMRVIVEAKEMTLDLDRATLCGLIITELVTNVLKYAFPKSFMCESERNAPCTLAVRLEKKNDLNLLTVSDNGVGMPENFDPNTATTLGLRLVNFLARHQLRATVEYRHEQGTEVSFRFRDISREKGSNPKL